MGYHETYIKQAPFQFIECWKKSKWKLPILWPFQYRMRRLIVRSHKVSMVYDLCFSMGLSHQVKQRWDSKGGVTIEVLGVHTPVIDDPKETGTDFYLSLGDQRHRPSLEGLVLTSACLLVARDIQRFWRAGTNLYLSWWPETYGVPGGLVLTSACLLVTRDIQRSWRACTHLCLSPSDQRHPAFLEGLVL